jgi:hypothetical protein
MRSRPSTELSAFVACLSSPEADALITTALIDTKRFAHAACPLSLSSYRRVPLHIEPYHRRCISVVIVECETLAGTLIFHPVWSWRVELSTFGVAKAGPPLSKTGAWIFEVSFGNPHVRLIARCTFFSTANH